MRSLIEVSASQIEKCDALQLTKLLNKLLWTETIAQDLIVKEIFVTEAITTRDGGEDGRAIVSNFDGSAWLTNQHTYFQCKASDLQPSKCKREVITNASANEAIKKAHRTDGDYVLFVNKTYSPTQINSRIKNIREALREVDGGTYSDVTIKIYDANKIRDWSNKYLSVITYIQVINGLQVPHGLKTYEEWQTYSEFQNTY